MGAWEPLSLILLVTHHFHVRTRWAIHILVVKLLHIFITLNLRHLPSLIHHLDLLILILVAIVVLSIWFMTCTMTLFDSFHVHSFLTSFARIVGLLTLHHLHLFNKVHVYGRQISLLLQLFFRSLLCIDQLLYFLMKLRVLLNCFMFNSFFIQHLHQFRSWLKDQVVYDMSSFIHFGLFEPFDFLD